MRQKVQKLGRASAIILFSVITIIIALVLEVFIAYVQQHELTQPEDFIRAALITLILSSIVFNYIHGLYQEIDTLEKNMNKLATYDELTGLLNRPVFFKACEKSHNYAIRNKQPYCLLAIKIDSYSDINEKYGISGGDRVLGVFGQVAQSTARDSDILSRLGGEEFAIFLPNTNIEQAGTLSNRLREHVKHKAVIHDGTKYIKYTVSIGIAINEHNKSISLEKGLKMADVALKIAQKQGGNQTEVFSRKSSS